jgi:hypothetical protein
MRLAALLASGRSASGCAPGYPSLPIAPSLPLRDRGTNQARGTIEHADLPLDPCPKAEASLEPPLLLVLFSLLAEPAALGQNDASYPRLLSQLLVLGRIETPVASQSTKGALPKRS